MLDSITYEAPSRSIHRPASVTTMVLGCACLLYVAAFVLYYPTTYSVYDEGGYLTFAATLKDGTWFSHIAYPAAGLVTGRGYVVKYPPGFSLLLVPFLLVSWKAAFALNLLLHLAGAVTFAALLHLLRLNPVYAVLYLFYPGFVFWSRTLMSDVAGAVLFLVGFSFFLRAWMTARPSRSTWWILSGVSLGLCVLVRYANALLILPLVTVITWRFFREAGNRTETLKTAALFSAPLALFAIVIVCYQHLIAGWPATSGYGLGVLNPSPSNLLDKLIFYFVSLNVFYPLMFCALPPFCLRARSVPLPLRVLIGATAVMFLGFYATANYHDSGRTPIESLAVGTRYLFPIIPLFLLGYAFTLGEVNRKAPMAGALALALLCLASVGGLFHGFRSHQNYLADQERMQRFVDANLPPDSIVLGTSAARELLAYPHLRARQNFWLSPGAAPATIPGDALRSDSAYLLLVCKGGTDCRAELERQRRQWVGDEPGVLPVAKFERGWTIEILRIVPKGPGRGRTPK